MQTDQETVKYEVLEREYMMAQWDIMETMDTEEPHLRVGWCGHLPMIVGGSNC